MSTTIILTRHGHVEGIEPRRFRGRQDVPLTTLGAKQAQATALRIAAAWNPVLVYTSPMARCIATGTAIAELCRVRAEVIPALNDIDYGAWQWKTHEEMAKAFPADYAAWRTKPHLFRFPKGEFLQDLATERSSGAAKRPGGGGNCLGLRDFARKRRLNNLLDQNRKGNTLKGARK